MSLELTFVGHATVLIELDGQRMLTDPLLRSRVWHVRRQIAAAVSVGAVDVVLISHGHYDHLDLPSLKLLGTDALAVAPRGLGGVLRRRGFRVEEVSPGDEVEVGAVTIQATPALHPGRRLLTAAPAVGYVIRGSASVYFAGDTGLFPELETIGAPGIDVALLPVWGWGLKLDDQHLDPEQAADAARLLKPGLAIPVHWGTYGSRGADVSRAPAERFAAACGDDVEVRILEPGERLVR